MTRSVAQQRDLLIRRAEAEPQWTEQEKRALRIVLAIAIGHDRVAVEAKKFLDGEPSALPTKLSGLLAESATVIAAATRGSSNENR